MPKSIRPAARKFKKTSSMMDCPHCGQRVIPSVSEVCPSCNQPMSAAGPKKPEKSAAASAVLYSPRQIFFLSLITGFPSGLALSSVNWSRTGTTWTAVVHWVAGGLALTIWSLAIANNSCGAWLGFVIHIGFSVYLAWQMKGVIQGYQAEGNKVLPATWKSGFLIALATIFLLILFLVLLVIALASLK